MPSGEVIFAAIVLVLLAPVLTVTTVRAGGGTYYVGTYSDDNGTNTAHCATPGNVDCSLRSAINAATSGADTIVWNANNTGLTVLVQGTLMLVHSVTIQGPGADVVQLSGGYAATVVAVNSGVTAKISGLTFENGHASFGGGGIDNQGSLTLTNCVVTNNTVTNSGPARGGGIITSGALTLVGTTISNNTITSSGTSNGLDISGPAIYEAAGTLTITNSTISGNLGVLGGTANGVHGQSDAAITIIGDATVRNTTISGNTAATGVNILSSGALNILDLTGMTTVADSTLSDNHGGKFGGAIYTQGALALLRTTITRNHADTSGGIYIFGGTTTLTDTLIAGNSGSQADGSGTISGGSANNLIGNGGNFSGVTNGSNGNQVGTTGSPIDPRLDPNGLQPNGGSGPMTIALLPNSPAIEAGGTCPNGVTTDERGQPRVGSCDIGAYEYQPVAPTLMDATGPASGGPVTFHGAGFQTGSRLILGSPFSVTLDAPASAVSADGTRMTLDLPPVAVAGPVAGGMTVTNPGLPPSVRATFTYLPVITSLSPSSGASAGGGSVMVTGAGFAAGVTSVTFGGTPATAVRVDSNTQITVTVPAHGSGAVDMTVTVNGVSATTAGAYTYGIASALPVPRPAAPPTASGGPPGALPPQRPAATSAVGGSPSPLPLSR